MLQRNTSGGALLLPTLDPPVEVPPGGEIDHPDLLPGFIPVEDVPAAAARGRQPEPGPVAPETGPVSASSTTPPSPPSTAPSSGTPATSVAKPDKGATS